MISTISNDYIKVDLNSLGAELWSIKMQNEDIEYLWQGNSEYWKRRSPLLFPYIGKIKDDCYEYNGKKYEMMGHGFARDCEFELVEKREDYIKYLLKSNDKTFEIYPFKFELYTEYKIELNKIIVTRTVINCGNYDMYFSIGEHPSLNCPLFPYEKYEDYVIEFEKEEYVNRYILEDGLYCGKNELFLDNENTIKLSNELFERKAIVLDGLKSSFVTFKSKNHNKAVRVSIEGFPHLGIWSTGLNTPFVCIEPWYRVSLKSDENIDISKKDGIISLAGGEKFSYSLRYFIS